MTLTELHAAYLRCYHTIQKERQLRLKVYRNDAERLAETMAEMNQLMADVEAMKNELKASFDKLRSQPVAERSASVLRQAQEPRSASETSA